MWYGLALCLWCLGLGFAAGLAGAGFAAGLAGAGFAVVTTATFADRWAALTPAAVAVTVPPPTAAECEVSSCSLAPVPASKAVAPEGAAADCESLCTRFAASPEAWDHGAEPTARPAAPSTPAVAAEAAKIERRECLRVMPAVARLAESMELDMRAWVREYKSEPLIWRLDPRGAPPFTRSTACRCDAP